MLQDGSRSGDDLRDGVREGDLWGPPRIRLNHGRLAPRSEANQVAWIGDRGPVPGCRDEDQMDRLVPDRILRDGHIGTVDEEGRGQRDERILLETGEPGEIPFEAPGGLTEDLGEGLGPGTFRQ